jgi:PAS domain S-box-containing protein
MALDTPADAILAVDSDLRIVMFLFSERFRLWNKEFDLKTNLIGRPLFEAFPGMSEKVRDEYRHVLETGEMIITEEAVSIGDTTYFIEARKTAKMREGINTGIITVMRDITERRKAEEALRESEERYRVAIENSNDGVAILRGEEYIYVNQKFVEMFGFESTQEITGKPYHIIVHPDDRIKMEAAGIGRNLAASVQKRYEFTGIRKDGTSIHIEVSNANTMYQGHHVSLAYMRDITELKHAEEEKALLESQLRQSQKMEAIGTLAGGIAHDFNNILTAIIGYGCLLQRSMEGNDSRKIYADNILASSHRAAVLIQSLLAFSRKQQLMELKPHKINDIVKAAQKLLERLLTEDIDFKVKYADPDITIRADAGQIGQVLVNFAANARDAMPKGGSFSLEIKAVYLDIKFVQINGYGKTGEYALITVRDTGMGMDRRTQEKIFEPFFTTKEVGKGTGLGLSIVYGIIKQHNGYISVYSMPGKGTTFSIYLPMVAMMHAGVEENKELLEEIKGGSETILIAEDNNEVRKLTNEILTDKGYTVIEAVDGDEAVWKFMEHKDEIDLLLLDVVMPKKNGKETYEEIQKIRPNIKVIFSSGYTRDVVLNKGIHNRSANFISKPIMPDHLLKKVRQVLDK